MKNLFRYACLALILFSGAGFATVARADVKIKTKNTSGGQVSEQTVYIKGKRQRTELNETSVMILQCDLRRQLQLGVPTKTYIVTPFDQKTDDTAAGTKTAVQTPAATAPSRRGGIVTSTFTATDTGERKKMFGYTARRIKTSIVTESSPDACNVTRSRMETDGWYIDAQFVLDCQMQGGAAYAASATQPGGCRDEYRTKQIGTAKTGYPVMVTTTLFDENGNESFSFTQEVVEIANAVLDNALFEPPADYRQVSDVREMYGAPAMAQAARDDDDNDNANNGSAVKAASAAGAKRPGVVRVGVAFTKTMAAADYVDPTALADAVRNVMVSNLNGSTVEVVALEARQTQGVESEAREKECDYVLYTTVSHKKGGGGGLGGFLKKSAAIAGGVLPPAESGRQGGAAGSLKARDELTLEYKLQRGADAVVANTLKAKAKADGDDIISQLAGQAATAVRAAAIAK
ncbi:MAG TPA: hypothetical protein VD835_12840 [Pyrinomonadaceae bacterium]|nr:hypothetical protein [Pyrinomonadaceae bacterium]